MDGSPPTERARKAWGDLGLEAVGVALIAVLVVLGAVRAVPLQWDFRVYLHAARTVLAGLDPYRVEHLTYVAGRPVALPFLYPPATLALFVPLAPLADPIARIVWMAGNVALLAGLIVLWRRLLPTPVRTLALVLVAVYGANAAALAGLRAGNVAILECTLLWSAFACFVGGRRGAFAALVVAAALFKLLPIVFLLLLLVPTAGAAPRPRLAFAALLAFGVIVWGPLALPPAVHWRPFLANLGGAFPTGETNPSVLALFEDLARAWDWPRPAAPVALWTGYALVLGAVSAPWLTAAWRARDARAWVMAAALLGLLLAPRPMTYGFVTAAAPLLFFSPPPFAGAGGRLALAMLLSAQGLLLAAHQQLDWPGVSYLPVLLPLVLWLCVAVPAAFRSTTHPAPSETR